MPGADDGPPVALSMLTRVPDVMGGSESHARALTRDLATSTTIDGHTLVSRIARRFNGGISEGVIDDTTGGPSTRDPFTTVAKAAARTGRIQHRMGRMDVLHVPFTVPASRPPYSVPLVQTLLNVQHLELAQVFSRAELAYLAYDDGTARRAEAVVTICGSGKRQVMARVRADRGRVHGAYLGVDTQRFSPQTVPRDEVVVYPAREGPHKHHARLVDAIAHLREKRPALSLVVTDGLETLGPQPDRVDARGLVPGYGPASLCATARRLAFPSLFEGFGPRPLEAMASGCPVEASTVGSIQRVCGVAAILFDPRDVRAMASAIDLALAAPPALARSGLERVGEFTWASCAAAHERVYQSPAARSSRA